MMSMGDVSKYVPKFGIDFYDIENQPGVQKKQPDFGVKFTGNALYFYPKLIFFPDPPSYGMSDVNPHLTSLAPTGSKVLINDGLKLVL